MRPRRRIASQWVSGALVVAMLTTMSFPPSAVQREQHDPFDISETTIESLRSVFASGELTCQELVGSYLERIGAHDQPPGGGPHTNAVQTVNQRALDTARELDVAYAESGPTGPLHCIPVLVKDQVETSDMPTTYGSELFADFESGRDATVVSRIRDAGGIVLAKTNMGEFASGWAGSAYGVCRNPYALDRAPSNSSCGTGVGIAANYGTVGIAEDTGGSTRGPAAWNNAVGLRPTTPLISRHGTMPAQPTYDTLGPLTRTVRDAATLTNVLAGHDPQDPITAEAIGSVADDYAASLDSADLEGKRVGIIREPLDPETDSGAEDYARVQSVVDAAYTDMRELGAEIVDPIEIPRLTELLSASEQGVAETGEAVDDYLDEVPDPPISSFRQIAASGKVTPTRQEGLDAALGRTTTEQAYLAAQQERERLREAVSRVMNQHNLDAIAYATFDHEPPVIPADQLTNPDALNSVREGSNRSLAPTLGFPALTVPAGFTTADLPVGIDLLGRPFNEKQLFEIGYAYEQGTEHRTPPTSEK